MSPNLLKLGLTSFFTDISSEMIYPFLGIYFATVGASPLWLGVIEGIAEGFAYILRVLSGLLSDYWKSRKNLTIVGYFLSSVAKVILFIFNSLFLLSLGRWIDRIGKGIRNAPRDALIAESVLKQKVGEAFGFHRFMDTLGATVGVFISLVILLLYFDKTTTKLDIIKLLIIISVIPAFIGVLVLFFVEDKQAKTKNPVDLRSFFKEGIVEIKNNKNLLLFFMFNFLFALSNSSDQFIFLKADQIKIELKDIVLSYLFYNLSYVLFSYPAGKISDKIPRKYLIGLGYLLYSITYFLIPLVDSFYYLLFIFSLYGTYKGLSEGVEKAFLAEHSKLYKASILGLQSTLYGIGILLASIIGGYIWYNWDPDVMFYFNSLTALFASVLIFFFIKK